MLTDAQCRNAICPSDKRQARLSDSGGLVLQISPAGSKRWFWKYRLDGKEKMLALGSYPAVSLTAARKARDLAKTQKNKGLDPVQAKKAQKSAAKIDGETFAAVAAEYMAARSTEWSESHRVRSERILKRDLLPRLGARPMRDIDAPELIQVLRAVEARDTLGVLEKARALCTAVWGFGVAVGKADNNVAGGLRKVFKAAPERHFAAIIEPVPFGELLRHIQAYQGGAIVKAALQLAPMLFQRPGELRGMAWAELDLDAGLWTIPSARMKRTKDEKMNGAPHIVPLARQAVAILRKLHPFTGHGAMVFPGERSHERPISDNTLRVALLSMGYEATVQTVHGFRASARTMLAERLDIDPLVIEAQLAHAVPDSLGRSYNRTQYLDKRTAMMQQWADYLDTLSGANVVALATRKAA